MRTAFLALMTTTLPIGNCSLLDDLFDGPCTLIFVYGVNVNLTSAVTGEPIEGAALTLTEGNYSEIMQPFPTGDGIYAGAGKRAGTYTLTIEAVGYESKTVSDIVVGADRCHVIPVVLDIELTPSS